MAQDWPLLLEKAPHWILFLLHQKRFVRVWKYEAEQGGTIFLCRNITSGADKATFGDYVALKKTYLFLSIDLNCGFWDASLYVSPSRWPLEGPRMNKVYVHLTENKRPHWEARLDLRWQNPSVFLLLTYFSHVIVSRFIHSSSANGTVPFLSVPEQYSIVCMYHILNPEKMIWMNLFAKQK